MGLTRRDKIARTLLIWTAIAAVALLLAGCLHVVGGRAVMKGPKLGQAIEWTPCRSSNPKVKLPSGAMCGKLAVPIDYNHLDGDVAALAMIRFPATGDKIASLVVLPADPVSHGKTRKLSDRDRLALDALAEATLTSGVAPPRGLGLPSSITKFCPLNAWRNALYANGALDRDAGNPRMQFTRLRQRLQAARLIGASDLFVWKA